MLRRFTVLVVSAAVGAAPLAPAAHAQGSGKAKARGKERAVVFVDADRAVVRAFWAETYGRECPPGLAKKSRSCLPPGHAKKRYAVGTPLSTTVVIDPVPSVLVKRLRPAQEGHRYVVVDGDVLLLATATRLVVDAIANAVD